MLEGFRLGICRIEGRLLAPSFISDSEPGLLEGRVTFVPLFSVSASVYGVHLPAEVSAGVVDGQLSVSLLAGVRWRVLPFLKYRNRVVPVSSFEFVSQEGTLSPNEVFPYVAAPGGGKSPGVSGDSVEWVDNGDGTGKLIIRSKG